MVRKITFISGHEFFLCSMEIMKRKIFSLVIIMLHQEQCCHIENVKFVKQMERFMCTDYTTLNGGVEDWSQEKTVALAALSTKWNAPVHDFLTVEDWGKQHLTVNDKQWRVIGSVEFLTILRSLLILIIIGRYAQSFFNSTGYTSIYHNDRKLLQVDQWKWQRSSIF